LGLAAVLLGSVLSAASAQAKLPAGLHLGDRLPGHYIVVLKNSVEHPAAVADAQAKRHHGDVGFIYRHAVTGYSATLSPAAVEALREDPRVKYVEPDRVAAVASQTTPTGVGRVFAPQRSGVDIDEVDDVRVNADVAIIDTGVDYTHPDLNVVARTDCVDNEEAKCIDGTGTDKFGHGTHVAGIVGALDNGFGTVGVAPGARIWAVKVLGDEGIGYEAEIVAGIDWVTAHASEIEVANMSLGGSGRWLPEEEGIAASVDAGVVYTVAAGNQNADASEFSPAAFPDVITVSALSDYDGKPGGLAEQNCDAQLLGGDDTSALYSNWGSAVDVAAPGSCIYSTLPTTGSFLGSNYGRLSGTSMAAPHVAGDAAIIASESNPNSRRDVEAIRQRIIDEGNFDWTDRSRDGIQEPLLDLRPLAIDAVTAPAVPVPNGVRLVGFVNTTGLSTSYHFEYGTTAEYGSSVPVPDRQLDPSSQQDVKVTESLGLKTDTTYHYRLVAKNSSGTAYGRDRTFSVSRWSVQPAPLPVPDAETNSVEFSAISCSAPGACTAVGTVKIGPEHVPSTLAERWSGSEWTAQNPPNPVGAKESHLTKVSCASATFCMAVGNYKEGGKLKPLAMRWDGSSWSLLTVPTPTPAGPAVLPNGVFNGVSCPSATYCVAVGQYVNRGVPPKEFEPSEETTLVEVWNGTAWSVQPSPSRGGSALSRLASVSCASTSACTAVGNSRPELFSGSKAALVERWNGTAWSLQSTPEIASASETVVEDVSCTSGHGCMAVGNAPLKNGTLPGFAMSWDGSEWRVSGSAIPTRLTSVSCAEASSCDAIGGTTGGEHWNGLQWTSENLAEPPFPDRIEVEAVSCAAKSRCTAVGYYTAGHGPVPLAERLNPGFSFDFNFGNEEYSPNGIAADGGGNIFVGESWRVSKYNASGELLLRFGTQTQVGEASGIAIAPAGDLWVVDQTANHLAHFNAKGEYLGQVGSTGSANGQFNSPWGVAIDQAGNLWVADAGNHRLEEFNSKGEFVRAVSGGGGNGPELQLPRGVAIDPEGHVWVVDRTAAAVREYSATGAYLGQFGSPGSGEGQLDSPNAIAAKPSGELLVGNGNANIGDGTVEEFAPSGEYVSQFGAGQLTGTVGIALAPNRGIWVVGGDPLHPFEKWHELGAPTVTAQESSGVSSTTAVLGATVNPMDGATSYRFEYGKSANYGATAPASPEAVGSGFGDVKVSQPLSGLTPGTVYHYRIIVANPYGTTYGKDMTFLTAGTHVPLVEAEKYPATISGVQGTVNQFTLTSGNAKCTSLQFSASISTATAELPLQPLYSGCKAFGVSGTFSMNSCRYVLHVLNVGPPYAASMDISCAQEGSGIVISSSFCSATIPAQSGLSAVTLANLGSESAREASVTFNLAGLKYTEGQGCASPGTHTNGTYTGTASLHGLDSEGKADGVYLAGAKT
jgi:subtilisin family serine protease